MAGRTKGDDETVFGMLSARGLWTSKAGIQGQLDLWACSQEQGLGWRAAWESSAREQEDELVLGEGSTQAEVRPKKEKLQKRGQRARGTPAVVAPRAPKGERGRGMRTSHRAEASRKPSSLKAERSPGYLGDQTLLRW